jgi:hypothetical protein
MVTPDHTHSKTPLNEGSARRRDLYLTTRNTQQTPTPLSGFVPTIPASELLKTHALDSAATGIGGTNFHRTITESPPEPLSASKK